MAVKGQKWWTKRLAEVDKLYTRNFNGRQGRAGLTIHPATDGTQAGTDLYFLNEVGSQEALGNIYFKRAWFNEWHGMGNFRPNNAVV